MRPYNSNPIEARKQAVRKHSRDAAVWAGGGVIAGVAVGLLASSWFLFILITAVGIVGGLVNYNKVRKIINHVDPQ